MARTARHHRRHVYWWPFSAECSCGEHCQCNGLDCECACHLSDYPWFDSSCDACEEGEHGYCEAGACRCPCNRTGTSHQHICNLCIKAWSCTGKTCSEMEWRLCPSCMENVHYHICVLCGTRWRCGAASCSGREKSCRNCEKGTVIR